MTGSRSIFSWGARSSEGQAMGGQPHGVLDDRRLEAGEPGLASEQLVSV